ncbi:hypothetical protein EXIGLDRAFT_703930 [Exidia glandulosa HHB12029]|uniref:Uncharacterized protein n=1 Tax=Exidia glandulosa HHB12029 TaxID=1314781 RepID=A0A165BWJ7_EXIGL|nr:hypothetical protein EXIGLDRAFT_703930 [Exidia glandulosa HHB12029]
MWNPDTWDIDRNDINMSICYDNVHYAKAPPVVGENMQGDFKSEDRQRHCSIMIKHWVDWNVTNRLRNWKATAPEITLDVSLAELRKSETIEAAHERALHMQAHPEQYFVIKTSTIVKDHNGETLISVLAPDPITPEVMHDLMQKTKKLLNFPDHPPDSGMNSHHKLKFRNRMFGRQCELKAVGDGAILSHDEVTAPLGDLAGCRPRSARHDAPGASKYD